MAKNPDIAAATIPTIKDSCRSFGKDDGFIINGQSCFKAAPAIVGTAIKNANRAASTLFNPKTIPEEIIIPDLLVPGISEIACATPKTKASVKLNEERLLLCLALRSEYMKYKETENNIRATNIGERNAESTISSNKNPTIPAGMAEIKTSHPNFCSCDLMLKK